MKYILNTFVVCLLAGSTLQAQVKEENPIPKPNLIAPDAKPFAVKDYSWQLMPYNKSVSRKRKTALKEELKAIEALFSASKNKEAVSRCLKITKSPLIDADRILKSEIYCLLGSFCLRYGVYDEAERYLKIALTERILAPDFLGYGRAAQQLAEVNLKKNRFDEALKYNGIALSQYQKALRRDSMASCYFRLSKINYLSGDRGEAEFILLKKALPLYTYAENSYGRMMCFKELGRICLEQSRFSEAKWFYIQHNILAKIQGNKSEIFNSVVGLAKAKAAIKDFDLAFTDLKEAQGRLNNLNDDLNAKLSLREAYKLYYLRKGNKTESETHNRKIIELKQAINKSRLHDNKVAVDILNTSKNKSNKISYVASVS